jgi:hypothetical protein
MQNLKYITMFVILLTFTSSITARMTPEEEEAWFNSDQDPEEEALRNINEGDLVFLQKYPDKPVHHHINTLIINTESLKSGWIQLFQCHENMDSFPKAQVVYNPDKIKNLHIRSVQNIGKAWVEGPSVQLENVKKGARLCVEADSFALHKQKDGSYKLRNGPFMRKFLDGYFPMRVTMYVKLPKTLKFASITPKQQAGFQIKQSSNGLHYDALFEGKLVTEILFKKSAN